MVHVRGVLDREPGGHRSDLFEVALPGRVGDDLFDDREEVEEPKHESDRRGRVSHGGGNAEAEQRDQREVEN
jgi:hypothetical protein